MNREGTTDGRGRIPRRQMLALAGGSLATGLAGCTGQSGAEDGQRTVVASFFTFYDFTRQITDGTPISVENLVPIGLHGHGWEPDPSITRDIVDAEAFVHVGPDFQPWADRAIETVRDDDADTQLINSREGVDLLDLADTVEDDEEIEGGKDPHFWLDPGLAQQAVDNIAAGLAEVAPEHESEFTDNAETLTAELDELDEEWEAIFERGEREFVFLAAHNAFEYLGQRYGATIQPLIANLAATDDVRTSDRQFAEDMIAEHDIQYIGAAIFEPNSWARQLVDETGAEAYYPVTPYAGTQEEWAEQGWGYFEIARNINMPTFEIVLDAATPDETRLGDEWRNFE